MKIFKIEIFVKRLLLTTSFIILFSCCAISQEQNDPVSTERGYRFGLTFDYSLLRTKQLVSEGFDWSDQYGHTIPILNSNSFFVGGGYSPFVVLTSLHNLNKDWDIGCKIGFFVTSDEASFGATGNISAQSRLWTSLLIATYGYYYPFENRYFIRFGLENNIYVSSKFFDKSGGGHNGAGFPPYGLIYYDKRNFRTSLSLGLGYNYNNTCLLNIGISIPFYNVYGYQDYLTPRELLFIHDPVKLYYTLSAGFTFLFI